MATTNEKPTQAKNIKKYAIEGQLQVEDGIPEGCELVLVAVSGDEELARADVDATGKYRLEFELSGEPPTTELRLLPKVFAQASLDAPAFMDSFAPSRYVHRESSGLLEAQYDLTVPKNLILVAYKVSKTYRLHGTVYSVTYSGGMPTAITPLPAVKIDFYEVDPEPFWQGLITGSEQLLGSAISDPTGGYEFKFDFSYWQHLVPSLWELLFRDTTPDIRARISQLVSGVWTQIYEGPVDWNIFEDAQRDYFIPEDQVVLPQPPSGSKPSTGFKPISLGLLPIDNVRFDKGYVTGQSGDPKRVRNIRHQPLCGQLRVFGLFAATPKVVMYKVQYSKSDKNGTTGTWKDLEDPLTNRKWNGTYYQAQSLGPDSNNMYTNIDDQPEADWHEHALKFTWNSQNHANGYYVLRFVGYDSSNTVVVTKELPVMRIDNTAPKVSFVVESTALGIVSTPCGHAQLPTTGPRNVVCRVTAHDPEGHMYSYSINASRGNPAQSAGPNVGESRSATQDTWNGVQNKAVTFTVDPLPSPPDPLANCNPLAYDFELHVLGSATDCYVTVYGKQRVKRQGNLVVKEV
jgi:hypothetical protein